MKPRIFRVQVKGPSNDEWNPSTSVPCDHLNGVGAILAAKKITTDGVLKVRVLNVTENAVLWESKDES